MQVRQMIRTYHEGEGQSLREDGKKIQQLRSKPNASDFEIKKQRLVKSDMKCFEHYHISFNKKQSEFKK